MAQAVLVGCSALGSSLEQLLMCDEIAPGTEVGYQTCKTIYVFHPLGDKIASAPIRMAQSQEREIAVPDGPEDDCRKAFVAQWDADGCENVVLNVGTQSRVYGVASLAIIEEGAAPAAKLDLDKLYRAQLSFNVLDPLNTAGSLVGNQNPNAVDFQKHRDITVSGVRYDRSRTVTLMNENPIYIEYNAAAFGYLGRSVYQRALFPLRTFVQTMRTDDLVSRKVGVLVAAIKGAGSVADAIMDAATAFKRRLIRQSSTEDVINITPDDRIESLNLQNLEGPMSMARKDCLENVATAVPMPAKLINNETFSEGFGEGSEDAKHVAEYVAGIRRWLRPVYVFLDEITMRRAWNPAFYQTIQAKYPEQYGNMEYKEAFYRWKNSFSATWPSLLQEPDSEKIKVDDTKFKAATGAMEVLVPLLQGAPQSKLALVQWFADALNDKKQLFSSPLVLDYAELEEVFSQPPPMAEAGDQDDTEPDAPRPRADGADPIALIQDFRRKNRER